MIICLNESDFKDFIKFIEVLYYKKNVIPPYISRVDVDNLWRLQSQKGVFLFTPYLNIEAHYRFDRIIFPYEKPYEGVKENEIYPINKSELEIHLDYYFNNEERIVRQDRFQKFVKEMNIPIVTLPETDEPIIRKEYNHESWSSNETLKWEHSLSESWESLGIKQNVSLKLPKGSVNYQDYLEKTILVLKKVFVAKNIRKSSQLCFKIELNGKQRFAKKAIERIEEGCTLLWNGVRNLPFNIDEIHSMLSSYIHFEYYQHKYKKAFSILGEELIQLKLINRYYSETKCYVSKSKIEKAFREDLEDILIKDFKGKISSEILLYKNKPQLIFDFNKLLDLFKEEIIAYQVVCNSRERNPVIFFSPLELTVLGYA